jgi:hypothetical protein
MSRSVDLPDSVYAALEEAATAAGTSPAEWIASQLPQPAPTVEPECDGQPPRTLAERLEGYIGLVHSGRGDLSERVSELFAEGMVEKHRARQLSEPLETASEIPVHLSACTFAALEEAASASGTTPEGLDHRQSSTRVDHAAGSEGSEGLPSTTLAERFTALVGGFRSERGDLADRHSELFMEGLMEKRRLGNL